MRKQAKQCPSELRHYIDLSRKFPAVTNDGEISEFVEAFIEFIFRPDGYHSRWMKIISELGDNEYLEEEHPIHKELRNELLTSREHEIPHGFIDFALDLDIPQNVSEIERSVWNAWARVKDVRGIAERARVKSPKPGPHGLIFSFNHTSILVESSDSTLGYFPHVIPGIVELIIQKKVPINRIRTCPICSHVFWALSTRSETCGQPCSVKLGNRRRKRNNGSL